MKKRLLLHYRADCNTNDIWRAAIQSGWSTDRIHDRIPEVALTGVDRVRYYGNTLHASRIADQLPFRFFSLDLTVLANTPLTKRAVHLCKLSELDGVRVGKCFIKPAQEKWFPARVYGVDEAITGGEEGKTGSLPDDLIYVQSVVHFINEVRCFCLDGKVHTASYYRVSGQYHCSNLDEERPKVIDDMVAELAPHYPRGVVLDFGYTDKGEFSFIEPNEAFACGVYSADYTKCLDVIEASQGDR
jgi:hypothetical protein